MHIYKIKRRALMLINQYKDSIARKKIVFWLIFLTYLVARLTQTKKGYKQQY